MSDGPKADGRRFEPNGELKFAIQDAIDRIKEAYLVREDSIRVAMGACLPPPRQGGGV